MQKIARFFIFITTIIVLFHAAPKNAAASSNNVFVGGFPAGFLINTAGAEVVGLCDVYGQDIVTSPSKQAGIEVGDIITGLNGQKISCASDIEKAINTNIQSSTNVEIIRSGQTYNLIITPLKDKNSGKNKLGLFVRDSMTGVGTVTYVTQQSLRFGALGHPVLNGQNEIVPIEKSDVFSCSIVGVSKGQKGAPGELRGIILKDGAIGTADKNIAAGLFGNLNKNSQSILTNSKIMQTSAAAKPGKATIFTTVSGTCPKEYSISIVKVDKSDKQNKNLVIKITDSELLSITGGIVQGMSGSPIVQDGKLIGAVTHVFINDPTRGYGILIDKMINE